MLSRLSSVKHLRVSINSFSSVIEIGDSTFVNSLSRALAVQREEEAFYGIEGNYNFPVFKEPIPIPPLNENVRLHRQNINPVINVSTIWVTGNAAASVIHIGSTCHVSLESRIKHIRQLRERA